MKPANMHISKWIITSCMVLGMAFISCTAFAQTDPTDSVPGDPGALKVYLVQNLSFGAFSVGNAGGTVTIANNGSRSVTGDVIALNMGVLYYQAIFDVSSPRGAIVSLINGPDATLTGSNGGTLLMHIGNSNPSSPFIVTVSQPARTPVNIGGTLTVGPSALNPPGIYNGTFYITFNQE